MNIIIDVTYLIAGLYIKLRIFKCKKCNVGYYIINYGVLRRGSYTVSRTVQSRRRDGTGQNAQNLCGDLGNW